MKYSKEFHKKLKDEVTGSEEYVLVGIAIGVIITMLDEIERLQAERRWIPVSERLPEKKGMYLTFSPDNNILIDYYVGVPDRLNMFVTHWMPLPPPPEEE